MNLEETWCIEIVYFYSCNVSIDIDMCTLRTGFQDSLHLETHLKMILHSKKSTDTSSS